MCGFWLLRGGLGTRKFLLSCILLIPQALFAIELSVIGHSENIRQAHPEHHSLFSLGVGNGSGLYPQVNSNGEVLFAARMWDENPEQEPTTSLYIMNKEGSLIHVLGDGDPLLGFDQMPLNANLSLTINSPYKFSLDQSGDALMMSGFTDSKSGENYSGLLRVRATASSSALLVQSQSTREELQIHSILAAVQQPGDTEEQVVAVSLNSSGNESALVRVRGGDVSVIARTGMVAPETNGAIFQNFPYPLRSTRQLGQFHTVVFGATLTGDGVTPQNAGAVFLSDETGLHLLARDGEVATGDAPGCAIYGSAYARMQITSAGGGIAFGAGVTCDGGGISIFSNRSGSLRREAYRDLVLDGPSGRFRLGFLSMVTATLGSLGDNPAYLYGLLDDGARLYVLSPLFHEDGTLRSSWGISKVGSGGYGEVLVESSALSSGLPVDLAASPFPEQISISGDGTVLVRVRELNSDSRVLLLYNYYTGITLVRDGSMIEGHTVTVGGSDRVSGIAMDGGQLLASVSVQSPQDGTGQPLRNAIVYLNSIGELSLPIVQGETQALLRGQDPVLLENFENPFGWEMRRNVANASPQTVFIGSISRAGMPQEDAILLLNWFQPVVNLADFNRDGLVTLSDLFAYLVAFFAGEPRADLNGDGVFSPQDIFQFLRIFPPLTIPPGKVVPPTTFPFSLS